MSKFNIKVAKEANTINRAGGVAFKMGSEQELVHAVLTTFLEDKFYESGNERLKRIQKLVAECKPKFVANLAVISRLEFNLRSVSHVLLGELSKVHSGDSIVKDAIIAASIRPDDVLEIASYVGNPMPKQVKRGIRNAILKYNRYQLAKYRGEGKEISMIDLFNLTHPKAQHATKEQKEAWKDLMEGNLVSFDTWETEISNAKDDKERIKIWENLILDNKIGYMALLRNLNNLDKYKVSIKAQSHAIARLTDTVEIKNSKQLPYRFYTAYQHVTGNRSYSDAISEAMDIALENVPELSGKTLIALDTSGSMSGDPIQKGSLFAATLAKANKNADVILYDTDVKELVVSSRTPIIDTAENIIRNSLGRGTNTGAVFEYATQNKKVYNRFIIISDNQSWAGVAQEEYKIYNKVMNVSPFVYAIDIQGHGTKDLTGGNVFYLTGLSDRLLDFIGQAEKGESLTDYVRNYEIPTTNHPMKKVVKKVKKAKK